MAGLTAARADHLPDRGNITEYVLEHVANAKLVIADLTELNPNVFYELGVRHVLKAPCIHLIEEKYSIPFDVASIRALKYSARNPARSMDDLTQLIHSEIANPAILLPQKISITIPTLTVLPTREAAYQGAARLLRSTSPNKGHEHIEILSVFNDSELPYLHGKESEQSWLVFFRALENKIKSQDWHIRHLWVVPSRSVLEILVRRRFEPFNTNRFQVKVRALKNGLPQITPLIVGDQHVLFGFGRLDSHIGACVHIRDNATTALTRDFFNVLWLDNHSINLKRKNKWLNTDLTALWTALKS
jgi:hypothetical protein